MKVIRANEPDDNIFDEPHEEENKLIQIDPLFYKDKSSKYLAEIRFWLFDLLEIAKQHGNIDAEGIIDTAIMALNLAGRHIEAIDELRNSLDLHKYYIKKDIQDSTGAEEKSD
jgi:hypothetical protein